MQQSKNIDQQKKAVSSCEYDERIVAVIVSYQPDLVTLKESILSVAQQVDCVLLVDNGSDHTDGIADLVHNVNQTMSSSEGLNNQNERIQLHLVKQNLGVGAAHNIGIQYAKEKQFDYILLLDQDSLIDKAMVRELLLAHKKQSDVAQVSAVGAHYYSTYSQGQAFFVKTGWLKLQRMYCQCSHALIETDFLISSGSLIALDSIQQIGLMDEGLFIDHIDSEWYLRAKYMGFKAYGVCAAKMEHGLGESVHKVRLLKGRVRHVPQHKPFRYYYTFRNSILLYKRHYPSWQWKWNDMQRLMMILIMFTILKGPRWSNAKMIAKGVWHGLLGRTGELTSRP